MKKNVLIFLIALLATLSVVIFIIINKNQYKEEQEKENNVIMEENQNQKIEKVNSASAYFTVQSCVNKYINYVTSKDTDSILKLLDSSYIKENDITKSNVLEKIENISGFIIFEAKKMYVEEIDENNKIYYVSGSLKEEGLETYTTIDDKFYITVNMNFNDNIFSIIPFGNEGLFNEE